MNPWQVEKKMLVSERSWASQSEKLSESKVRLWLAEGGMVTSIWRSRGPQRGGSAGRGRNQRGRQCDDEDGSSPILKERFHSFPWEQRAVVAGLGWGRI